MHLSTTTLKRLNRLLRPWGVCLRRDRGRPLLDELLRMESALKRVATHDVRVSSVLDLGASNGWWSVRARNVFPDARFLGVDPLAEHQPALEKLHAEWPAFSYALCAAGGPSLRETDMHVSADLVGSTIGGQGNARRVPVRTVDELVVEHALPPPYLLKFDTHGYEMPILDGATRVLPETQILIMEVYNFDLTPNSLRFPQMCVHLESLGFRCYDLADPMLRPRDQAFWQCDLLFLRKEHPLFRCQDYA